MFRRHMRSLRFRTKEVPVSSNLALALAVGLAVLPQIVHAAEAPLAASTPLTKPTECSLANFEFGEKTS